VKKLEAYRCADRGEGRSPGSVRVTCPARTGKVACALFAPSMARAAEVPVVEPDPPTMAAQHPVCTQRDITMPLEARGKHAQDGVPFTKAHNKRYFRRGGVERGYAKDKDRGGGNIGPGDIRTMGRTKIGFLLVVHHGAQNLNDMRTRAMYAADEVGALFTNAARRPRGLTGSRDGGAGRSVPPLAAGHH
jgi:hypothetical protein